MPSLVAPALAPGALARLTQPELGGDRVRLRPWRPDDGPAVAAAYADPAIRRWHCRSMTDDEARDWIDAWPRRWHGETGAGWAVVDADDPGGVLGQISLRRLDLAEGLAEVSYWVLPAARGRRVAPSALAALAGWSFTVLGLHRVELAHSTANPASCRVAERAGFAAEGTKRAEALHTDGWHDMHLHARLATDAPCRPVEVVAERVRSTPTR
ncbi:GNAT family N-acetyltransferase [Micromonospora sp. NPDC049366]|uniref:GNAT family N-acetyltransferase n=1 Tax=Micromonospora sp. NPDC049366 TaxID=3364271 RepID=UPI0037B41CDB